jgi:hypothetical protein
MAAGELMHRFVLSRQKLARLFSAKKSTDFLSRLFSKPRNAWYVENDDRGLTLIPESNYPHISPENFPNDQKTVTDFFQKNPQKKMAACPSQKMRRTDGQTSFQKEQGRTNRETRDKPQRIVAQRLLSRVQHPDHN